MDIESTVQQILLPAVIILTVIAMFAFIAFDRLLQRMYEHHRGRWKAAGRPATLFLLRPPGSIWSLGTDASAVLSDVKRTFLSVGLLFLWLFVTPAWATQDHTARRLLLQTRTGILVFCLGVIGLFLLLAQLGVPLQPRD